MEHRRFTPPSYADLRTTVFKDHPFHCADCNTTLLFKNMEFRFPAEPKHASKLMLSTHADVPLCNNCFANRIIKWFKIPQKELTGHSYTKARARRKCDVCNLTKITAEIIWEQFASIRFGTSSWNNSNVCKDCLVECVLHGRVVHGSSTIRNQNNKYTVYNEVGARVEVESVW